MLFRIQPDSATPIYRQIVDQVREAMVCGRLAPGDRLPSLREAASELVINLLTVKQAYNLLEHDGLIETQRGRGTFVCAGSVEQLRRDVFGELMRQMMELAQSAQRSGLNQEKFEALARRAWRESE